MRRHNGLPAPTITELAVDPADVDRATYPVTLRLSRSLTQTEVESLARNRPDLTVAHDGVVVPEAKLDDLAHDIHTWNSELERIHSAAEQLEGEHELRRVALARRQAEHTAGGDLSQHMH